MAKELTDIREELQEALTTAQRAKRRASFRKAKARIQRGRKLAQKRLAPREKLEKRAQKQARKSIESKILGGKTKADLPFATRSAIEKKVDQRSPVIKRLAKRLYPKVRKTELERLKQFRSGGDK
jgi:multidrug resistance efflux pump